MAELIMMVGPSYSGKSTIAERIANKKNGQIFSSDSIRGEIYGDENIQRNPAKVFEVLHNRVKEHLRAGGVAIYDATNLNCKRRMSFLRNLENEHIECKKTCVVVVCAIETMKVRMAKRERVVPWEVVHKQICSFQAPGYYEGWDNITVEVTSEYEFNIAEFCRISLECDSLSHDNPNHTLTIGEHMQKAGKIAESVYTDLPSEVRFAITYHDIGKFYTKRFENGRGEPTEIAHFIGHQNYSAYLILTVAPDNNSAIRAALLAQWHMEHYLRNEKGMEKLYGWLKQEGLYEYMRIMERADKEAH